ncbi:MAG: class I SAM-dependent methyltransferase [Acidimicrobiales bacterium]|nr:class I SAM-dependent methyltransferase [Acidimicrobiales bacterium]
MTDTPSNPDQRQSHWDHRYVEVGAEDVSWYEPEPTTSLELLDQVGVTDADSVIDVGGGASRLVDALAARGHTDLTVLDVSQAALDLARQRLGDDAPVTWVHADLLTWTPERTWAVWHDRAVFHFLTDPADRATYRNLLQRSITPGGLVVVGTFAADGPEWCSGLPVERYDPDHLASELGDQLRLVAATRTEHHTPSGATQPFTWVALRA